jgi:hypothetical protein
MVSMQAVKGIDSDGSWQELLDAQHVPHATRRTTASGSNVDPCPVSQGAQGLGGVSISLAEHCWGTEVPSHGASHPLSMCP